MLKGNVLSPGEAGGESDVLAQGIQQKVLEKYRLKKPFLIFTVGREPETYPQTFGFAL